MSRYNEILKALGYNSKDYEGLTELTITIESDNCFDGYERTEVSYKDPRAIELLAEEVELGSQGALSWDSFCELLRNSNEWELDETFSTRYHNGKEQEKTFQFKHTCSLYSNKDPHSYEWALCITCEGEVIQ